MIKNIIKKSKIRFFWITLERFPNLFRPSSKPYLSGDTLRNFSDHIFDESKSIDPKNIKNKDIVFVNTDVIDIFFKTIFQEIKNDFVLITHNSDVNIESSHLEIIDSRVIHWFAQNLNIENKEKVSLIPIGLENLRRLKHGRRKWFSNPEKEKTKFIFRDNNLIDVKKYEKVEDYFSNLQDYRFIICPEGNGLDTHRIWEGILLNTFPILKFSNFTQILQNEGIPAIYIENWEEINDFNEKDLNKIYQDLLKTNTKEYILFNYWKDRINNIRNSF